MRLFLDSAEIAEIRECAEQGIIDGVTTNPSLVARTGRSFREVLVEICEVVRGPVSAEVIALDAGGMVEEARALARTAGNVVVKLPLTMPGLKAAQRCAAEGIKTNLTICFSPLQALLAAKAGASYVSPFVGRTDDVGTSGMELVRQILAIYRNYGFKTEVLVASVRGANHVLEAALQGAHACTVPYKVLQQIVRHPLTDSNLKQFLEDWKTVPRS
jgi:transaldolase